MDVFPLPFLLWCFSSEGGGGGSTRVGGVSVVSVSLSVSSSYKSLSLSSSMSESSQQTVGEVLWVLLSVGFFFFQNPGGDFGVEEYVGELSSKELCDKDRPRDTKSCELLNELGELIREVLMSASVLWRTSAAHVAVSAGGSLASLFPSTNLLKTGAASIIPPPPLESLPELDSAVGLSGIGSEGDDETKMDLGDETILFSVFGGADRVSTIALLALIWWNFPFSTAACESCNSVNYIFRGGGNSWHACVSMC